jgi:hypothetical protein
MTTRDVPMDTITNDPLSDGLARLIKVIVVVAAAIIVAPLLIPIAASKIGGDAVATKTTFWVVRRRHRAATWGGIAIVVALVTVEGLLLWHWATTGGAHALHHDPNWKNELLPMFGPWVLANFLAGVLLLPAAWSIKRRRIAELVRTRHISDVVRQEKIESARKRAADLSTAERIGVRVDRETGTILGLMPGAVTVPTTASDGRQVFGFVNRISIQTMADRFFDIRRVRDWVDPQGLQMVLPNQASAVRAMIIAESGTGKTVLINDLVLSALQYGWPVIAIDAKGDPVDAEHLVELARANGASAEVAREWDLFNGTAAQITSLLMRLMPAPDGANQHYLDEIRGVLQAVQDSTPLTGVQDLRERLSNPNAHVRDRYDLALVNQPVDRNGTTSGMRALQALMVALRPLEEWLSDDGWSYRNPPAQLTVVPISTSDDAQARVGDLLLFDLRNYLATRMKDRDRTPVVVIVDEFAQLVTGNQDPGDTAGALFETARSAGVGLLLAAQSPAGISNDENRRRRALTSGAALILGRSKDPEELIHYAGTVMRMEASGRATGEALGSGRAQHTSVIHPQDVREAADGAFWLVQAGAIAPFRALPHRTIELRDALLVSEPVDVGDGADDAPTEPAAQLPAS